MFFLRHSVELNGIGKVHLWMCHILHGLQVTGADVYVLYSTSWPVQTVIKQINKTKKFGVFLVLSVVDTTDVTHGAVDSTPWEQQPGRLAHQIESFYNKTNQKGKTTLNFEKNIYYCIKHLLAENCNNVCTSLFTINAAASSYLNKRGRTRCSAIAERPCCKVH